MASYWSLVLLSTEYRIDFQDTSSVNLCVNPWIIFFFMQLNTSLDLSLGLDANSWREVKVSGKVEVLLDCQKEKKEKKMILDTETEPFLN